MRAAFFFSIISTSCLFIGCQQKIKSSFLQASEVQLSPPVVHVKQVFFYDSSQIQVEKPFEGAMIQMVTGEERQSLEQITGNQAIPITSTSLLRFKTMGDPFISSEEVTVELFQITSTALNITKDSKAKAPYNQSTSAILVDHKKASKNFNASGWLGYQQTTLNFELDFIQTSIQGLAISVLEDQASWIFAPASITASFYNEKDELLLEAQTQYEAAQKKSDNSFQFLKIPIPDLQISKIKLQISNLQEIPDWHPGHGSSPWLFIDEIFIF